MAKKFKTICAAMFFIIRVFTAIIVMTIVWGTGSVCAAQDTIPGCPYYDPSLEVKRDLTAGEPAMAGKDVVQLQERLKELNFYREPVDGIYGPSTIKSVKEFQKSRGLDLDGVVDEFFWQELDEVQFAWGTQNKIPPPAGAVSIVVDTYRRKLTVFSDGEPYKQYPVAVGKYETPSPIGTFKVLRKGAHWGTGFGTRWIGLTVPWGVYGIHGTNKPHAIGSYASHGCIRMNNHNVEEIYPWVKPGTPVTIIGNQFSYQPSQYRTMRRDERGGDVMEVQIRLQRLGFYSGPIDGIWGGGMEKAVMQFRQSRGLTPDNSVNSEVYHLLGLE
ncbi:L,D-transpeptidase family protein [Desulfoscipio sp. XC116]|uniref:L,D-transpeptidase family protein n=1 Tax=Desulfoscipio sp. XC116 TaxID=3144975 RepID=UPI00325AFEC4